MGKVLGTVILRLGMGVLLLPFGGFGVQLNSVPPWLRDAHYPGAAALGHGQTYIYPHDLPGGVAEQQYLPDILAGSHYYQPTTHGAEAHWAQVAARLEQARRGEPAG